MVSIREYGALECFSAKVQLKKNVNIFEHPTYPLNGR